MPPLQIYVLVEFMAVKGGEEGGERERKRDIVREREADRREGAYGGRMRDGTR